MATVETAVAPLSPWGMLPKAVRLLFVAATHDAADWLAVLLDSDRALLATVEADIGAAAGLAKLRSESYAALVVQHLPGELDALEFMEAHRAGGGDDPLIVVGHGYESAIASLCYEAGADAFLPMATASPREMIWAIGRAIEWHRLKRENRRLSDLDRQRLKLEHREAERLLAQQRSFVSGLGEMSLVAGSIANSTSFPATFEVAAAADSPLELPASLVERYRELLRAYVVMGSGNLAAETAALVDSLHAVRLPAPRVMQCHLHALEETLSGLGSRSSRHVMSRADLLVLEVMVQLAERYRQDC